MRQQAPRPTGQEKAAKYAAAGKMQIPDRDRLREPAQAYLARRAKKRPPLKGGRCICGAKVCRGGSRHRFRCLFGVRRHSIKPLLQQCGSFVVCVCDVAARLSHKILAVCFARFVCSRTKLINSVLQAVAHPRPTAFTIHPLFHFFLRSMCRRTHRSTATFATLGALAQALCLSIGWRLDLVPLADSALNQHRPALRLRVHPLNQPFR